MGPELEIGESTEMKIGGFAEIDDGEGGIEISESGGRGCTLGGMGCFVGMSIFLSMSEVQKRKGLVEIRELYRANSGIPKSKKEKKIVRKGGTSPEWSNRQ